MEGMGLFWGDNLSWKVYIIRKSGGLIEEKFEGSKFNRSTRTPFSLEHL